MRVGDAGAGAGSPGLLEETRRDAAAAQRSRAFRWLVRAGFLARAITYGVIGVLALALAVGAGTMGATPNQEGALALIARAGPGRVALIVICAGLLAYAVWKFAQALLGQGPEGGGSFELKDRVANAAGGVVYLGFFAVALRIVTGSSGNSTREQHRAAAGVLSWPAGPLLVGIAGAGLIAVSLYQFYDAVRGRFAADSKTELMSSDERRVFMLLGRIGLVARALVFALIGYFVLRTAIDFNPNAAVGVDGALARLHHQPFGAWLVGLAAAGLLTFCAFSLFEARYRRL